VDNLLFVLHPLFGHLQGQMMIEPFRYAFGLPLCNGRLHLVSTTVSRGEGHSAHRLASLSTQEIRHSLGIGEQTIPEGTE